MKPLFMTLALLSIVTLSAQDRTKHQKQNRKEIHEKWSELPPEQLAELRVKRLALALDLTDTQQQALMPLEVDNVTHRRTKRTNRPASPGELTAQQLYEVRKVRLDRQIAYKKMLKSILTASQYQQWEEHIKQRRHLKMRRQGHKKR